MPEEPDSIVIIGLDGADPQIIQRLHEQGRLEHLSGLIDEGAFSTMHSTHIPITPSAWTSMLTGMNPGKHGVFGFTELEQGRTKLVSATHTEDNVLDHLSADYDIGYANVPATFPVQGNGVFEIAGILAPDIETDGTCHPAGLADRLAELDYELDLTKTYTGDNEDELIEDLYDHLETKAELFGDLQDDNDLDIEMYTFMVLDWASHWFWKHMDEDHPQHEPSEYQDTLEDLYVAVDQAIGELIEDADTVLVVSDHGFTRFTRGLNLNPVLRENGHIHPKKRPGPMLRYLLYRNGITIAKAYRIAKKLGLGDVASEAAQDTGFNPLQWLADRVFFSFEDLDWDRTTAYSAGDFGPIYIEADGEERDRVIEDVTSLLEDLKDGDQAVIEETFRKDDIYHGPHTDKAPDIVYAPRDWTYHATRFYEFGTNNVLSEPFDNKSGHHHPEGIFIAAGDGIADTDTDCSILDFAPTLLHLLGEPIPADMDGKPVTEILATDRKPQTDETAGIDI
jgi:predicted AlkP superfamily phosphohydrolase/phosphomutase